jgi:tetratricopeptide (TPR) repeat protein
MCLMHFVSHCCLVRAANFNSVLLLLAFATSALAADLDDARKDFYKGRYAECVKVTTQEVKEQPYSEEWRMLLIESLMATGRYTNALAEAEAALNRSYSSIRLRLLARDVFLANGVKDRAEAMLEEIDGIASRRSRWTFRDAANLVALGRTALLVGADPRRVLENFYDRAKAADASLREVYLAIGELAIAKGDYALAERTFTEGLKRFADDSDMHFGLAQAYAPSDRRQMLDSIEAALDNNTNHVPSLLLLAEHLIDGEEYETARKTIDRVLAVNPAHPIAWAAQALLAHLSNDPDEEKESRSHALEFWSKNPAVDHFVGRKLSQKYRFAEGAAHQRRALQFDRKYVPAKIQLAQDLLRLGEEDEGWALCHQAYQEDGYDVTAYNLVTLEETIKKFATLTNENFIVRMSKHEAEIYGDEVLALLERARTRLCEKYQITLERPTTVEIFPNQKDFGVRTFGMPHNPGFLGVCFGPVVTANSPASQAGHEANWQAVLWHEFCHVVTLQMTRNRMPRWLSEGISVYEERQANPTWGQAMSARYREMVLGKDLVAVSELSSAFLAPRSDLYLQFAYFESSLVVDFLIERFGKEHFQAILRDLGQGTNINAAIEMHTTHMNDLEEDFALYARKLARKLGPDLDWTKAKRDGGEEDEGEAPEKTQVKKDNYYELFKKARELIREKKWQEAKAPLKRLIEQVPVQTSSENAYLLLAQAHRQLGETNEERRVLSQLAEIDADDTDTFERLIDLALPEKDWSQARRNAERYLAVNPLVAKPYLSIAETAEALDDPDQAISAWRKLLLLDPPDPPQAHFRLARLLHKKGDPAAKLHVLKALEEAPRFRDAQRLLLEIERESKKDTRRDNAVLRAGLNEPRTLP